ncbi:MAG: hypothetical protein KGY60_08220 [Bacteroidales bacterium]|nr:hypothetical protein [Bacteroidales bacterium]
MSKSVTRYIIILVLFALLPGLALAQEEEEEERGGYEDLLFQEVEVENPVYYPVLSVSTGIFNYIGEMSNDMEGIGSMPPLKINVYHFLDSKHHFRVNIYGMSANINGSFHEIPDSPELEDTYEGITNFQTEMLALGLNFEYGFGHFYEQRPKFRPFIALGGEVLIFNPRSDYMKDGVRYDWDEQITLRNYDYEYNLRNANVFDLSSYSQNTPALTLDVGFDFALSSRVSVRISNGFHYTFSDLIDGMPYKDGDGNVIGNKQPDMLNFTYFTFGWDPFSESETKTMERLFADISDDFDYTVIADQDRDGITDLHDDCPEQGTMVDSTTGCPIDSDRDGVPDFRDEEPNTPEGVVVDEQGVQMSEQDVLDRLNYNMVAVKREDSYMMPVTRSRTAKYTGAEGELQIPGKFRPVDKNNDGEISYEELLLTIDRYFNGASDYNADDIYELNDFFFAQ